MAGDTVVIQSAEIDPVLAAQGTPPPRRRRRGPRLKPWWIRTHRWASLALGLVLLVQVVTGSILLMQPEVMRWTNPGHYVSTPSADPLGATEALALVQRERPELDAVSVNLFRDVWVVTGNGEDGNADAAFVDPGTGEINAVGPESPWIMRLLVNIHDCALACQGYPGYLAVMEAPIPGLGEMTVGAFVLGSLGVLLIFMCVSGAVIWWPTIRRFASGFRVRRGRGPYARNLDLHKLVGIIALPLLLMWAVSGANFEFQWIGKVYYAALPGADPGEPEPPDPGTGPQLSVELAQATALALHPDARVTGVYETTPAGDGGSYGFSLRQGFDAYKDSYFQGQIYVQVDSHGGGATDYPKYGGPVTQQYWENWQNGLHFGSLVPWIPRLPGVVFGLAPVLLAITGITVWLTKRRSRRNRAWRARLDAARTAATASHTAPTSAGSSP